LTGGVEKSLERGTTIRQQQAHSINGHETIEQNEDGRRFRGEFTHSTFGRMQARLQRRERSGSN
jgi:hypothetical protein